MLYLSACYTKHTQKPVNHFCKLLLHVIVFPSLVIIIFVHSMLHMCRVSIENVCPNWKIPVPSGVGNNSPGPGPLRVSCKQKHFQSKGYQFH